MNQDSASAQTGAATPVPWRVEAMGGASTVLASAQPKRNDARIPSYCYDPDNGHCIAYPFLDDDNRPRLDFVCFSHADAALIVRAVNSYVALQAVLTAAQKHLAALEEEARTSMSADVAEENFSDSTPEVLAAGKAMLAASVADKELRAAIAAASPPPAPLP